MQQALSHIATELSSFDCEFSYSVPLSGLTTLRIGGPAAAVALPKNEGAFLYLLSRLHEQGIPRYIVGNGSNLLAPDEGYRGVIIRTSGLHQISMAAHTITAACGARLSSVAALANRSGIGGFTALAGIPGSLGGAVFMNAGAGGQTVGERILSVRVLPAEGGTPFSLLREECHFSYRKSLLRHRGLVLLSATLTGPKAAPSRLYEDTATALEARRRTQPLDLPSAGSTFLRPPGEYAGRLIEAAGLKGRRIGGAMVSPKHAGFIVNVGGATAADVKALVEEIRATVLSQFGISLVREIEYL